jgi:hypothetical protein
MLLGFETQGERRGAGFLGVPVATDEDSPE